MVNWKGGGWGKLLVFQDGAAGSALADRKQKGERLKQEETSVF